jgi:phosphoesterase RecJ-like protein
MQDLNPKQQAIELIGSAQKILIVSHKNPDGDALGCVIALKLALEKLGKKVTAAVPDRPSKLFSFLPNISSVKTKIDTSKDLILTLSLEHAEFGKIGYRKNDGNTIDIFVTPKEGRFESSDVQIKANQDNFDLIIIVDTPNIERLGGLADPADIFYEIPTINIDHHPANEKFGKINWVELVATSSAEMLVSLIEALGKDKNLIDENIATALLTGLIYDTSSFQNVNTTPKSLTIAAQLVAAGANQQEIIRNLYKTKSLETLKLWGNILTKIKEDKIHGFLWSSVTGSEIEKSGADESALSQVVDELLKSASDVDFALLLSERGSQVHGSLRSIAKGTNVSKIAELFGGGGHEVASAFRIEGTLAEKEDEILQKIREYQAGHAVKPENVSFDNKKPSEIIEKSELESQRQEDIENSKENLEDQGKDSTGDVIDLKEEFKEDIETKW